LSHGDSQPDLEAGDGLPCYVDLLAVPPYGGHYRVFFVRAPDGLCFCIGTKEP
jgi:hypothetical protein